MVVARVACDKNGKAKAPGDICEGTITLFSRGSLPSFHAQRPTQCCDFSVNAQRLGNRLGTSSIQMRTNAERMIDDDVYCIDILTQVSAATKALESTALVLLDEHLRHCVTEAIQAGGDEADAKVGEASAAIARLVRS